MVPQNWLDLDNPLRPAHGRSAEDVARRTGLPPGFPEADHRARLGRRVEELVELLSARASPRTSACTSDTTVSSSTFVSVTGMAQDVYAPLSGTLDIAGGLYVEELTAGEFSARIVNGASVLWTVTVCSQASLLLEGPGAQLSKWSMPIGGPDLLDVVGRTEVSLDVEIAAPSGSYKVLAGSGKESALQFSLIPSLLTE